MNELELMIALKVVEKQRLIQNELEAKIERLEASVKELTTYIEFLESSMSEAYDS